MFYQYTTTTFEYYIVKCDLIFFEMIFLIILTPYISFVEREVLVILLDFEEKNIKTFC